MMKRIFLAGVAILIVLAQPAFAQEKADAEHDARMAVAKEYLKTYSIEQMVNQMMDEMGKNPQLHLSASDLAEMKSGFDYEMINKTTLDALVKTFTVDELKMM